MAYGRFRRRGFRRFRRRGGFRRFSRYRGMRRALRGYRRPTTFEVKVMDEWNSIGMPTLASPGLHLVNGLIPGSNFWGRVGSRISMKSVYLKITLNQNVNWTGTSSFNRIVMFYDKQAQGAAPTMSDIYAYIDNAGSLTTSAFAPVNPVNRDRFVIIMDRMIQEYGRPASEAAQGPQWAQGKNSMIKKYIRLKNLETLYNSGATGTISDIMSGSLYIAFFTTAVATTDNPFSFYCSTRLRWTD